MWGKKMHRVRACTTCGRPIYLRQNSEGRWVPFDASGRCHFETCSVRPNVSRIDDLRQRLLDLRRISREKRHKIPFEDMMLCRTLQEFMGW